MPAGLRPVCFGLRRRRQGTSGWLLWVTRGHLCSTVSLPKARVWCGGFQFPSGEVWGGSLLETWVIKRTPHFLPTYAGDLETTLPRPEPDSGLSPEAQKPFIPSGTADCFSSLSRCWNPGVASESADLPTILCPFWKPKGPRSPSLCPNPCTDTSSLWLQLAGRVFCGHSGQAKPG